MSLAVSRSGWNVEERYKPLEFSRKTETLGAGAEVGVGRCGVCSEQCRHQSQRAVTLTADREIPPRPPVAGQMARPLADPAVSKLSVKKSHTGNDTLTI